MALVNPIRYRNGGFGDLMSIAESRIIELIHVVQVDDGFEFDGLSNLLLGVDIRLRVL